MSKIIKPDGFGRAPENWGFRANSAETDAGAFEEGIVSSGATSIRLSGNPHPINCHDPSCGMILTTRHNYRSQREN